MSGRPPRAKTPRACISTSSSTGSRLLSTRCRSVTCIRTRRTTLLQRTSRSASWCAINPHTDCTPDRHLTIRPFILKDSLTDRNTAMMNENAMANVLVDVDFLEEQFRGAGRAGLVTLFSELRAVRCRPSSHHYRSSHTLDFLEPLTPSPPADNIDRPLRFRRRIPRTIAAPDDVRPSQTKETHCGTREAGTLWRKLSRPTIP